MTRDGIFYNLKESHHTYVMDGYTFYFSSSNHVKKFKENVSKEISSINSSLTNRFGHSVQLDILGIIRRYTKVETRGFLIYDSISGVWFECLNQITLNGERLTKKN